LRSISDKAILFFGMYPIDRLDYACPVRIFNLYQNLRSMAPTILITGTRASRRWPILRFLFTGKLRKIRCIYVESATSTATETDLLLLLVCKLLRTPIVIYIRDAYQFFPDIFDRSPLKVRVLDWLWKRSIRFYILFADVLLFPSEGLARQFKFSNEYHLLPPAGSPGFSLESLAVARKMVLYVGAATSRMGADLLLEAMKLVVQKYTDARCVIVTSEEESRDFRAQWENQPWLTFSSGSFNDLPALMRDAYVTVVPIRRNTYNDFALPVKLFDYMSFGKPLVVTNCAEMAKLVNDCNCGLVVEDTPEDIACGIIKLFDNPELAKKLGANSYRAVQEKHSWRHRAKELLAIIEKLTLNGN